MEIESLQIALQRTSVLKAIRLRPYRTRMQHRHISEQDERDRHGHAGLVTCRLFSCLAPLLLLEACGPSRDDLQQRVDQLEKENEDLRAQLADTAARASGAPATPVPQQARTTVPLGTEPGADQITSPTPADVLPDAQTAAEGAEQAAQDAQAAIAAAKKAAPAAVETGSSSMRPHGLNQDQ